jgi:hypothetical protein
MPGQSPTFYVIDAADRISSVNDAFWHFAERNGWSPNARDVLGHSLWEFVDGDGVSFIYRWLHDSVRRKGRQISFAARCDSPTHKRTIGVALLPAGEGAIRFAADVESEIEWPGAPLPAVEAPLRRLCTRCIQIECKGGWIPVDQALAANAFELGFDEIHLDVCGRC